MAGKIFLIGVGIDYKDVTLHTLEVLQSCDYVMGHRKFYEQLKDHLQVTYVSEDDIRDASDVEELNCRRIEKAVSLAEAGNTVGLLSGGDPGIWASAGYFVKALGYLTEKNIDFEVLPGIPAFLKANAFFGAPLNFGFSLLPLCDEWLTEEEVFKKIEASLETDQVICLYKPIYEAVESRFYPAEKYPFIYPPRKKSLARLEKLHNLLLEYRSEDTPVGIFTEHPLLFTLKDFPTAFESLTYFAVIIVGSSLTAISDGKMVTTEFSFSPQALHRKQQ